MTGVTQASYTEIITFGGGTNLTRIMFRPGALLPPLTERAGTLSLDLVAKRDLDRYYTLIRQELGGMPVLTETEASLIADAVAGGPLLAPTLLWVAVYDAVRVDHAGPKWGLTPAQCSALVERLRLASPGLTVAIVDACERVVSPEPSVLRRVGLLSKEETI